MIRRATLLWVALLGAASTGLYQVKYTVQELEDELAQQSRALRIEQQAIHVLRAEWAYLNRPERLAELADRHLRMRPVSVTQIADLESLPIRAARAETRDQVTRDQVTSATERSAGTRAAIGRGGQ